MNEKIPWYVFNIWYVFPIMGKWEGAVRNREKGNHNQGNLYGKTLIFQKYKFKK